jgi:pyridoxine/pyridoxamine 5'-phosphate oxidase
MMASYFHPGNGLIFFESSQKRKRKRNAAINNRVGQYTHCSWEKLEQQIKLKGVRNETYDSQSCKHVMSIVLNN